MILPLLNCARYDIATQLSYISHPSIKFSLGNTNRALEIKIVGGYRSWIKLWGTLRAEREALRTPCILALQGSSRLVPVMLARMQRARSRRP